MKSIKMKTKMWMGLVAALMLFHGCDFGSAPGGGGTGGQGLTGILVDANGTPAANIRVRVYPEGFMAPAARALSKSAKSIALMPESTLTDAEGKFKFVLSSGRYNLMASLLHGDTTYAVFVQGIQLVKSLDLGTDTLRASGSLRIRVRDAEGHPVAGAHCFIAGSSWSSLSDVHGFCELAGVAPGTLTLTVETPGGARATGAATVTTGQEAHANFSFTADGQLAVPPDWTLVGGWGYAFSIPWEMELIQEFGFDEGWSATYFGRETPSEPTNMGLEVSTTPYVTPWPENSPEYTVDTIFQDGETRFVRATYREGSNYYTGLKIETLDRRHILRFDVRMGTLAGRERALRILASVRKWTGPGPAPVSLPMKAELISPSADTTVAEAMVGFSWEAPLGLTGTAHYRLQVAADPGFHELIENDTMSRGDEQSAMPLTRLAGPFQKFRSFYWRVLSIGPQGIASSPIRRFHTGNPPQVPVLKSPVANATGLSLSPILTWGEVMVDVPDQTFRLQVSRDSLFETFVLNDSIWGPNFNGDFYSMVGPLEPSTRYFWRVIQMRNGLSVTGAARAFTTKAASGTEAIVPTLGAPNPNATGVSKSPIFNWTSADGIGNTDYYHLQVSEDSLFLDVVVNDSVTPSGSERPTTSRTIETVDNGKSRLKTGATYFWRVLGVSGRGATPSSVRKFTVE